MVANSVTVLPVYGLSQSGKPLVSASLHPEGAAQTIARALAAGVEVSADQKLVDGIWLQNDVNTHWPHVGSTLKALLISIVEQGMLLRVVKRIEEGEGPAIAH